MQGEGTQGLGTPMYVRIYVEAPEASKTVSLSLSLYADCALGWREKEPWARLPPYHSPQMIETAFRTEVAVQDIKESC